MFNSCSNVQDIRFWRNRSHLIGISASAFETDKQKLLDVGVNAFIAKAFREALDQRNVTRTRRLGEEAQDADPVLAAWLLERIGRYDLEGLKKLDEG